MHLCLKPMKIPTKTVIKCCCFCIRVQVNINKVCLCVCVNYINAKIPDNHTKIFILRKRHFLSKNIRQTNIMHFRFEVKHERNRERDTQMESLNKLSKF